MLLLAENLFFEKKSFTSLNAVISTNESTGIIIGHMIYNLAYTYKFQLKTIQAWPGQTGLAEVYR